MRFQMSQAPTFSLLRISLSKIFLLTILISSCRQHAPADPAAPAEPQEGARIAIPVELSDQFSGEKALSHIIALEKFGPRPPASAGYEKSLRYLEAQLATLGWSTMRQSFRGVTPIGPYRFTNLLARYGQEPDWDLSPPYLLGSHLDTKRYPKIRFMGSNDSGSSTGVLVELARVLSSAPASAAQVELVFFDGEEAFLENIDPRRDGLYGSRYYAAELDKRSSRPEQGILLDLVGDLDVPLLVGIDSGKEMIRLTATAAGQLGIGEHLQPARSLIIDDHLPLIHRAKVPMIHLIGDFQNMPYWHTANDTLANLETEALENAGRLTLRILHLLKPE